MNKRGIGILIAVVVVVFLATGVYGSVQKARAVPGPVSYAAQPVNEAQGVGVVAMEGIIPQVGDANGDGAINVGDVIATERMILGLDPMKTWADANWNGEVDMGDVVYLQRIILGRAEQIHP